MSSTRQHIEQSTSEITGKPKTCLVLLTALAISFGLTANRSFANSEQLLLPPTLKLELRGRGLQIISQEIEDSLLNDIENQELPNAEGDKYGFTFKGEGMKISIEFGELSLVSMGDFLRFHLSFSNLKVHFDKIMIRQKLGSFISADCFNTDLYVGSLNPVELKIDVNANVKNQKISIDLNDIEMVVADQNLKANGPSRCSGNIIARNIFKRLVSYYLNHGNKILSKLVRKEIEKASPEIAKIINRTVKGSIDLDLVDIPGVPETRLTLTGSPRQISLKRDLVKFSYDIAVSSQPIPQLFALNLEERSSLFEQLLLRVGLNTQLLNQLFTALFSNGSTEIEVNDEIFPGVSRFLTRPVIGSFIPDLLEADVDQEHVKIFLKIIDPPQIYTIDAERAISARLPKVQIRIAVSLDQVWTDYYFLTFDFYSKISTSISDDKRFLLKILSDIEYGFSGRWADGYQPQIDWIEDDVLELFLDGVFDSVYEQDPLLGFQLPVITIGGAPVTMFNPALDSNYLYFDIVEVTNSNQFRF